MWCFILWAWVGLLCAVILVRLMRVLDSGGCVFCAWFTCGG